MVQSFNCFLKCDAFCAPYVDDDAAAFRKDKMVRVGFPFISNVYILQMVFVASDYVFRLPNSAVFLGFQEII